MKHTPNLIKACVRHLCFVGSQAFEQRGLVSLLLYFLCHSFSSTLDIAESSSDHTEGIGQLGKVGHVGQRLP